jgi:hypothetical protein
VNETTTIEFHVETRRRKGWRRHYEPVTDLFDARLAASSLVTLPGVETRVTDGAGRVWS